MRAKIIKNRNEKDIPQITQKNAEKRKRKSGLIIKTNVSLKFIESKLSKADEQ